MVEVDGPGAAKEEGLMEEGEEEAVAVVVDKEEEEEEDMEPRGKGVYFSCSSGW